MSPAYGFSALALVKCSNEEGPGPRHNMKEDVPVPLEERLGESTVRPRVQDQKPRDRQEEDEEAIVSFSADF